MSLHIEAENEKSALIEQLYNDFNRGESQTQFTSQLTMAFNSAIKPDGIPVDNPLMDMLPSVVPECNTNSDIISLSNDIDNLAQ